MKKALILIAILLQFCVANAFAMYSSDMPNITPNIPDSTKNSTDIAASSSPKTPHIPSVITAPEAFQERNENQYFDWAFFSNKQGTKNLCYIAAMAIKKNGDYQERGEPYFIVTKTAGKLPEVSVSSGYYYKKDSEVELTFGLQKFYLLTYKNKAWSYSIDDDIELIKAMRDSESAIVTGTSNLNKSSEETYSLIGFNKAYDRLQKECQ